MHRSVFIRDLLIACLLRYTAATQHVSTYVHERRSSIPKIFVEDGPASDDGILDLRISLLANDPEGLQEGLYAVSTPGNPAYRQHLSKAKVEALVSPSAASLSAVESWLSSHNLSSTPLSPSGDLLNVRTTVAQANNLLKAMYTAFTRADTGARTFRTLSYSLPESLRTHVNFVHPTVMFPVETRGTPMAMPRWHHYTTDLDKRDVSISCNSTVTPTCVQQLYGLPAKSATQSSNGIAVAGFINQWANSADLQLFLKQYRSDVDSSTGFSTVFLDGGSNLQDQNSAGMEAGVDIQWTIGLASGVPVTFYSVGEDGNNGGINGWIDLANYLLSQDHPPQVLTTSYSFDESDVPISVASSLCNLYAQLGARGTSIIFSSGDGGVAGGSNKTCTSFVPTFPSTCPYVTSVGATSSLAPEVAAQYSSGGFSNYFGTPSYQTSATSTFLNKLDGAYSGIFNVSGRGFPDVSAQGANMASVYQQQQKLGGGTSFAAPVFASTVALLNAELGAAGKAPLGFLNPLIYSATGTFTDIVHGSNPGCGTGGFSAVSGWDPVSGVGTPIYSALRSAVGLS